MTQNENIRQDQSDNLMNMLGIEDQSGFLKRVAHVEKKYIDCDDLYQFTKVINESFESKLELSLFAAKVFYDACAMHSILNQRAE